MTSSSSLLFLLVTILCQDITSGASFSNVIVQRGSDVLPIEYINYNPSALTYTSQVARLSQAPLQSVISEPLVSSVLSPCVSPCVIPNAAPVQSTVNAKIGAYKTSAANVPVILTNKDESRGYQYAYAVFDVDTGDKKTQSERSDGSVVQGHYSFIQPDGFLREVVYTADDLKGFNAIVRNISPEPEHKHTSETEKSEEKHIIPPCKDNKNEHLTHAHERNEEGHPAHEQENHEASSSEEMHVKQEHLEVENLNEKKSEEASAEKNEENVDKSHEHSAEKSEKDSEENSGEKSVEKSNEEVHPVILSEGGQESNLLITYSDIVKCLQSKLQGPNVVSPLTYVLLPSSYKPC